ncbi:MAG: hypothetical protein J6C40_05320 [Lentisphaeria bacterium]|nr:hypothetical protein [Lentisphaeria bacterium]
MTPALIIGDLPFYDTPSEIEGSPYWVDLWAEVNGRKIGLQVKPTTYKSANISIYMGKARSSEEQGHKKFYRDFGGRVFIITPCNGTVSADVQKKIIEEKNLLLQLPPI